MKPPKKPPKRASLPPRQLFKPSAASGKLANKLANAPKVANKLANRVANTADVANVLANTAAEVANKPLRQIRKRPIPSSTYISRDPDKRRAYMREYMRKRRAE